MVKNTTIICVQCSFKFNQIKSIENIFCFNNLELNKPDYTNLQNILLCFKTVQNYKKSVHIELNSINNR